MSEIGYIKLSELNKQIENAIKGSFPDAYWIVAEVSGHKFYTDNSRHYLTLIEKIEGSNVEAAKVQTQAWKEGSQAIKYFEESTGQKFQNGLQVLVKVRVNFHVVHGLALSIVDIDQAFTLGNIEKQRHNTLAKLVADNPDSVKKVGEEYYTKNKSLKFNIVIQNIAIIGSPNSEGFTDFTHTIKNNQFKYKFAVDIYQSAVQGVGSETELVNKLIDVHKSGKKYDCVVIIRGGGAKTDFLVFDTYSLAKAVARFPIPIITGIGHTRDVSIVDLMANTNTKTPTKAAEFIISHNHTFEDRVLQCQKAIAIKSQQLIGNTDQKLNASNIIIINKSRTFIAQYKDSLNNFNQIVVNKTKTILYNRQTNLVSLLNQLLSRPKIVTANKNAELNNIIENLKINSNKYLSRQGNFINHYVSVMKLMNPKNILKKGFAIVSQKGKIIKDAESITSGSDLLISMDLYDINTKVISKTQNNGKPNYL
jgi:exodeoxyribonuclease VII large subunit